MNKYQRQIPYRDHEGILCVLSVDVYDVLKAFDVRCPATQHAIKKLLMPGGRGAKTARQDLEEAIQSIMRAVDLLPPEKPK